jgi:hypothetical protein
MASDAMVCFGCIGDDYLKREVRKEGFKDACSFCGQTRAGFSIERLAERIRHVLEAQFMLTPAEPQGVDYLLAKEGLWERRGEPVTEVLAEIAGLDGDVAQAVQEYLSNQTGYKALKNGEDDPFAPDAMYEEHDADTSAFEEAWDSFCMDVAKRSRFFSRDAQKSLYTIFGDLTGLKTLDGVPVIRAISPSDGDRYIFRARVSFSGKELEEMLADPVTKLGPPPFELAKAGRMNAAGISVFYGAMDEETCIAEARAPVGSHVVTARFEIIRPVRLLDFDALTRVYFVGSHFDPEYCNRRERAAFLRRLVARISRPVMPRDEEFEYLATQALSDYLSESVALDGVVFHSSQRAQKARNVVLFNHACRVEHYDLPVGTTVDINMGWVTDDDSDDSITVIELTPAQPAASEPEKIPQPRYSFGDALDEPPFAPNDLRAVTLKLDMNSIKVRRVHAVTYETSERSVTRRRMEEGNDDVPF